MLRCSSHAHLLVCRRCACVVCLWPAHSYFTGNVDVSTVAASDWTGLLSSLLSSKAQPQSAFAARHGSTTAVSTVPEVLLTFVYPKLSSAMLSEAVHSTTPGHFDYVKRTVQSAGSYLWLPYLSVPAASSVHNDMINTVLSHSRVASVMTIDLASRGCAAAKKQLKAHVGALKNGVTDSITIMVDENDDAQCMQQLVSMVAKATEQHYVAVLTAAAPAQNVRFDFGSNSAAAHTAFVQQSASFHTLGASQGSTGVTIVRDPNYPGPLYISPMILLGVCVAIGLLFVLYIGINCLMGIERPIRMSTQPLQLSKEY